MVIKFSKGNIVSEKKSKNLVSAEKFFGINRPVPPCCLAVRIVPVVFGLVSLFFIFYKLVRSVY